MKFTNALISTYLFSAMAPMAQAAGSLRAVKNRLLDSAEEENCELEVIVDCIVEDAKGTRCHKFSADDYSPPLEPGHEVPVRIHYAVKNTGDIDMELASSYGNRVDDVDGTKTFIPVMERLKGKDGVISPGEYASGYIGYQTMRVGELTEFDFTSEAYAVGVSNNGLESFCKATESFELDWRLDETEESVEEENCELEVYVDCIVEDAKGTRCHKFSADDYSPPLQPGHEVPVRMYYAVKNTGDIDMELVSSYGNRLDVDDKKTFIPVMEHIESKHGSDSIVLSPGESISVALGLQIMRVDEFTDFDFMSEAYAVGVSSNGLESFCKATESFELDWTL